MNEKPDIKELDLSKYPAPGTYTRKWLHEWGAEIKDPEMRQWNINRLFSYRGNSVHVERNYQVSERDKNIPKDQQYDAQMFTLSGLRLHIWVGNNSECIKVTQEELKEDGILYYLDKLITKLANLCQHQHTKELSQEECSRRGIIHFGMCYHVTECLDCGDVRSYDSSG